MYTIFVFLSALPFFPFIIVWAAGCYWARSKKKAFMLAMDVTTFFLIASVGGLYNTITDSSAGFYWICLMMLLAIGLLGGLQNRKYGKMHIQRLARTIWRLAFFILSILYIILLLIGIIAYAASV